jgi:hypothetical protein
MRQPSTSRPGALATLLLVTMLAARCGHSSPVAPDVAARTDGVSLTASDALAAKPPAPATTTTFPLNEGTFTIGNRKGELISGTYSGVSSDVSGVFITTLQLTVTDGTGSLAGASGVLEGKGRGAFIGEGQFSLDVSGSLSAGDKKNTKFGVSLQGWSNIGCDGGTIVITLNADGSRGAKSSGELRHEVGNAGCTF